MAVDPLVQFARLSLPATAVRDRKVVEDQQLPGRKRHLGLGGAKTQSALSEEAALVR